MCPLVTVQGADAVAAAGVGPEAAKGDTVNVADSVAGGAGDVEGSSEAWVVASGVEEAAAMQGRDAELGEAGVCLSVTAEHCLGGVKLGQSATGLSCGL